MRIVWRIVHVFSELGLFFAMLFVALQLIDVYMVASGQITPGGPTLFHEASSLGASALLLAVLAGFGAAMYFTRKPALQMLLR